MTAVARTRTDAGALLAAAAFFVVAVLLHNADHLRRGGDSVSGEVFWVGTSAMILEIAVVALVVMRHPGAPAAAAAIGFTLAAGYIGVHFTPERTFFSDSFFGDAAGVSIAAAVLETVSAVALGIAGALGMRGGIASSGPAALTWRQTLLHPLVLAMAAGNAVILVGSLLSRYGT